MSLFLIFSNMLEDKTSADFLNKSIKTINKPVFLRLDLNLEQIVRRDEIRLPVEIKNLT